MKTLFVMLCSAVLAFACTNNDNKEPGTDGGTQPQPDSGSGSSMPDAGSGSNTVDDCISDSCVCATTSSCEHTCSPGGNPCHVQCQPGQPCDVTCEPTEECHVEAITSGPTTVDCKGTFECHVTCPQSGCTVTNCTGLGCVVSCGYTGTATKNGTTATCP